MELYIHIPYCRQKCRYCDFASYSGQESTMAAYVDALLREADVMAVNAKDASIQTVFIGGGTPSILPAELLTKLLTGLHEKFDIPQGIEFTSEANPGTLTEDWLDAALRGGVNRLSMGMQSSQQELLKTLGRIHRYEDVVDSVRMAKRAGVENINIDLMFGLPGQTPDMWRASLDAALALDVQHLSCYGLIPEEGTPLTRDLEAGILTLPDEDDERIMYDDTLNILAQHGFRQYEISNFAKPGYECRHNLKYWTGQPYIGFGPAAASDFGGKRFTAEANLDKYITGVMEQGVILSECETIPARERAGEYLMLRLRTTYGIEENEYMQKFLLPFAPLEKLLLTYEARDLAAREENGRWRLTPKGFMVSNSIILQLLEAQQQSKPLSNVLR